MVLLKNELHIDQKPNEYQICLYDDFISKTKQRYKENPLSKHIFEILVVLDQISDIGINNPIILDNNENVYFIFSKNLFSKLRSKGLKFRLLGKYLVMNFNLF